MFETERRVALHLIERSRREYGRSADLLVLFRIVDIACHRSLGQSELVEDHLGIGTEDLRKFGGVVSEAYRSADRALGQILEAFGEANVVVVSDHGFQREVREGTAEYQHNFAPPGIFLAAGPAIRPGPVEGLSIFEIMPLLVRVKGFPVAADLPGRLREDILEPAFLVRSPLRRVASYGRRGAVTVAQGRPAVDEEMLERLRALGYVQ
jgi:hypothetical protein